METKLFNLKLKFKNAPVWLVAVIGAIAILLIPLTPLLLLWALNTLLPIEIPYTFVTWLAAFVVIGVLRGNGG